MEGRSNGLRPDLAARSLGSNKDIMRKRIRKTDIPTRKIERQ